MKQGAVMSLCTGSVHDIIPSSTRTTATSDVCAYRGCERLFPAGSYLRGQIARLSGSFSCYPYRKPWRSKHFQTRRPCVGLP